MSPRPESLSPADRTTVARLAVDRIACTGHGACAGLLPDQVRLDEWGYPVLLDDRVDGAAGATAVRLCPARALYLR